MVMKIVNAVISFALFVVLCGLIYSVSTGGTELTPTIGVGGAVVIVLLIVMVKGIFKANK